MLKWYDSFLSLLVALRNDECRIMHEDLLEPMQSRENDLVIRDVQNLLNCIIKYSKMMHSKEWSNRNVQNNVICALDLCVIGINASISIKKKWLSKRIINWLIEVGHATRLD